MQDNNVTGGSKCCGSKKAIVGFVLFVSIVANIFMGGMLAGGHSGLMATRMTQLATVVSAFADLSPASRDKAVAIVKKNWPDIEAEIKAIRKTRAEVKDLMAKTDYKRADLDKKFAELRAEVTALQTTGQNTAADIADAVTPEERVKLCNSIDIKP